MIHFNNYLAHIANKLVLDIILRELFFFNAGKMINTMTRCTTNDIATTVTLKAIPIVIISRLAING